MKGAIGLAVVAFGVLLLLARGTTARATPYTVPMRGLLHAQRQLAECGTAAAWSASDACASHFEISCWWAQRRKVCEYSQDAVMVIKSLCTVKSVPILAIICDAGVYSSQWRWCLSTCPDPCKVITDATAGAACAMGPVIAYCPSTCANFLGSVVQAAEKACDCNRCGKIKFPWGGYTCKCC